MTETIGRFIVFLRLIVGHEVTTIRKFVFLESETLVDLSGDLPQCPISKLEAHQDRVTSCSFNPKKSLLATSGQDNTVRVWSVPNRTHQFLQQTCVFNR